MLYVHHLNCKIRILRENDSKAKDALNSKCSQDANRWMKD